MAFDYVGRIADPIRPGLIAAHRKAWQRLAEPGRWWTGTQRVAIAAESRVVEGCPLCRARRAALSPFAFDAPPGLEHGRPSDVPTGVLPPAAVDAVHRLVSDANRLTKAWVDGLAEQGVPDTHYVELLSVVVSVRSIDVFHRVLGLAPEPLPEPRPGEPSRIRPEAVVAGEAWVPMLPRIRPRGDDADLWPGQAPYVVRAMSLVPDAVRWLKELSSAHYLDMDNGEMFDFVRGKGPLSRAQTELVAGRVSALNECFY